MPNIVHRIGMDKASPEELYKAVATRDGLASWWTEDINGESRVGRIVQFRFGKEGPDFEVLELTPGTRVRWKCVAGAQEWVDTRIQFDINSQEGETVLRFKHCGWREEGEYMYHCSTRWAYFLLGLRQLLEGGEGRPYPRCERISRW
jgi:uncharacterized protein YndB with AHSA1/START domain